MVCDHQKQFISEWPKRESGGLITAANVSVDTFFVISGLLVVYIYLVHKEKGQHISLGMFYVHRILRLTPSLAALILFQATLIDQFGSGPFWPLIADALRKGCEKSWWPTLLYIQNYFIDPRDACLSHSWYLAVDTQLYFLSPILLLPLVKWPKRILFLVVCLVVTCSVVTFGISWWRNLTPAYFDMCLIFNATSVTLLWAMFLIPAMPDTVGTRLGKEEMMYLYCVTHTRASAWLTGVILGYILFRCRNKEIMINKMMYMALWITSLSLMVGIMAYHNRIARVSNTVDISRLETAFANSMLRLGWAIGLSVVIFLCVTGYGGSINRFLSNPIFTVLVRINYNTYLIHILVIQFSLGQTKTPKYSSFQDNFYYFWGDYIITSIIAVIWTLSFESPIIALEKLMFSTHKLERKTFVESERYSNTINVVVIDNKKENDRN